MDVEGSFAPVCQELENYAPMDSLLSLFPDAMREINDTIADRTEPSLARFGEARLFVSRTGNVVPNVVVGVRVERGPDGRPMPVESPQDKVHVRGLGYVAVFYYSSMC